MNLKEILINAIVIIIIVGSYCVLFTFLLLSLINPVFYFTIISIAILVFGPLFLIIVSKGPKKHVPLVAEKRSHVGIAALDCFTWGHFAGGIFSFLVELFFIERLSLENGIILWWGVMQAIVLIGITWEIIENSLFIEFRIRCKNHKDNVSNIFSDVFFVSAGGILMIGVYIIVSQNFIITLIIGIIAMICCGIIFYIHCKQVLIKLLFE